MPQWSGGGTRTNRGKLLTRIRNIKELAALAKVSTGTVSRALAGSELISKTTRERIQAIADLYGFQPNVMARNLRTQRTGAIGVLVPAESDKGIGLFDQFFIFMLGMVAGEILKKRYDLLLSSVDFSDDDWLERVVGSGRAGGYVVIGQASQLGRLDKVAKAYRPLVAWGESAPGQIHCSVGSNNRQGGYLAAQHLIERGCRRLAFFGDLALPETRARHAGCADAVAAAGLVDGLALVPLQLSTMGALDDARAFLRSGQACPDGIIAASDVVARSLVIALVEHGLTVPDDVKVVGYDGLPMSEFTIPRLTTISQNLEQGAALLVDLLCRRIAGEDPESVVMEPELLVRKSS